MSEGGGRFHAALRRKTFPQSPPGVSPGIAPIEGVAKPKTLFQHHWQTTIEVVHVPAQIVPRLVFVVDGIFEANFSDVFDKLCGFL
jgi:hypothetical protein